MTPKCCNCDVPCTDHDDPCTSCGESTCSRCAVGTDHNDVAERAVLRYECAACSSWGCYLPLTAPHIPREALAGLVFRLLAIRRQLEARAAVLTQELEELRESG